ncbi:hypothetical protein E2C01_028320 [Portunus trituberculatus]|uniref:Uncharacterized protein n=1 Tax=Portunus trituberculatus TaxID=210409 RepID=A0A5B7ENB4_PORTR|nr:hypothetical protein [Portunus trituberculatus]
MDLSTPQLCAITPRPRPAIEGNGLQASVAVTPMNILKHRVSFLHRQRFPGGDRHWYSGAEAAANVLLSADPFLLEFLPIH